MKVIILIVLLAFATTASALDLKVFIDDCSRNLTSLLDVVEDLIRCVVALLHSIVHRLVRLLHSLLHLDLEHILRKVFDLIPSILRAVECECHAIVDDVLRVVHEIVHLLVRLLQDEGSVIARFLSNLIEPFMGTEGMTGIFGDTYGSDSSDSSDVAEIESL